MWRGLYSAATGMMAQMNRTETIANNLANANTTGYKRDEAIDREFEPMLLRRVHDDKLKNPITDVKGFSLFGEQAPIVGTLGMGAYTAEIATDFAQGAFETTGNQLDLGISGEGFFAIQTPQGVRYTRNGNFYRAENGNLVTSNGQNVLDTQGRAINLPENATRISVSAQGEIFADGANLAQLRLVEFGDRRAVLKQGDNLYYPQEGAAPRAATGEIQQGVLERANTNVVNEMVELINNYRIYEANSKAVTSQDELLGKSVNDVGRLS